MTYKEKYELWKSNKFFDECFITELENLCDEKEIEDRFYKELEFGTGGLRGIMGAGSNRMNKYTVRKAAKGFGLFLLDEYKEDAKEKGVAVAYDTRNNSKDFAKETALTIANLGIKVYLFEMVSATPLLSFAVRYLGCAGGVVITASHNTKEYNGFKAYDKYGCQLSLDDANKTINKINELEITKVESMDEQEALEKGLLEYIGEDVLNEYSLAVRRTVPEIALDAMNNVKIVYTPLHGSGNISVRRVLEDTGFKLNIVKEQELPNGDFPTVKSPNPGNEPSLALAKELGEKLNADIVVGSDPDADRAGVLIRHNGKLEFLDGNSMGAFILYYLIDRGEKSKLNNHFITTIVSGELASNIAAKNGLVVDKVLTGFKFIGEVMTRLENENTEHFMFGCEESYGFLAGDYVRDKCAAFAILTMCSACAYYKNLGKSLGDIVDKIHAEYGFYDDALDSYVFKGKEGADKMKELIQKLKDTGDKLLPNVDNIKDYSKGIEGLPKSDVLKYFFNDGSWMAIRPSGTEPQIKVYYSSKGADAQSAHDAYLARKAVVDKFFEA